jgi:hypothetical protein
MDTRLIPTRMEENAMQRMRQPGLGARSQGM